MQFNKSTDNTIPNAIVQPSPSADQIEIKRIRKILLVLVGFFFVISVLNMLKRSLPIKNQSDSTANMNVFIVGISFLPILFDTFGIFVIRGYHRKGVSVFAWLKTIEMIFIGFFLAFIIYVIGHLLFTTGQTDRSNRYSNIPTVLLIVIFALFAVCVALKVIVIKYTFKLARLLKSEEQFNNLTV
ncbi:unnamed protein product [Rotaria socialis]|uniref:Uncharacterized protein n=1 Tax=Rotaria socialis TaxID=392032 RepID=A0A817TIW0_9BILA|nr:unnamed protein product [Rotaria socialis]